MGHHTQYIVSLSQEEKNKLQAMSKDNKLSVLIGLQCRLLREKDEGACHVLRITCQGDRNDVPEGEQDNDRQ